ncbi:MAG: P-loop NTPase fold protein, partial [Bdellovibrionales bacterium]|nr:P-loop NTPase fold protein [Bdellovibrionales bacterium]
MVCPNWDIFKTKFSENKQSNFEWFCYLLFCKEFNQFKGIKRYTNQTGIETNPIDVEGKNIGFQAKFFETRLSEHKTEFKTSIDKTKEKHPEISKLIFYINQDFGEGVNSSDPQYKLDIESHATDKNLNIEWRTASYFESPFVCEENKKIAHHFFSLENSIFDFIDGLSSHTEALLSPIQSKMAYEKNEIRINRSCILNKLKNSLIDSPAVILTGEAGSGKTAIIKDWHNELKEERTTAFFVFKATEFNISHINNLFKNYGNFLLSNFIEEHKSIDRKYIIIDSAEKLSDLQNNEAFKEFLSVLISNNWKVVFTTRYNYLDDLRYQLLVTYDINLHSLNVPKLTLINLTKLSKKYDFNLPTNQKLLELLQTPFFLSEYLKTYSETSKDIDYLSFKRIIWNNTILKSSYQENNIYIQREKCFLELVKKRVNESLFLVTIDGFDNKALQALKDDEIIEYNSEAGGYFITHDIYEEWALGKIIERAFCNKVDYKNFFNNIGNSLPVRRAFRDWLSEKLYVDDQEAKLLIEESIQNNSVENHWKDEILVSVLLSNYCSHFFEIFESELLEESQQQNTNSDFQNNFQSHYENGLLYKLVFLLRTACKEADESVFDTYGLPKTDKNKKLFNTIFIQPKGKGWNCLIDFMNKYKAHSGLHYTNLILPVIEDWNIKNRKGETTKNSSQLALYYYEKIMDEEHSFKYNDVKKRLIKIIFNGSFEMKEELKNILQSVISKKETDRNSRYYRLIHTILISPMEAIEVIKNFPEQVIQLADLFWTYQPKKKTLALGVGGIPIPDRNPGLEECFSITSNYEFKYFPPNALNTPILPLLIISYKRTVDFILSFTNKSIQSFASSRFGKELKEVDIFIDDKTSIKQYISPILWNMYRGDQTPNLLESIHMALERYFLKNCKDMNSSELEEHLLYLLKNSKSASISAVVASIVLAYPEKTFNVAKVLFQTKEFFLCDNDRCIMEHTFFHNSLTLTEDDPLLKNERIEPSQLDHRKKSLERLALQYQIFALKGTTEEEVKNRQQTLWKIFDNYYQQLPNQNNEQKQDKIWILCLARMDRRKMKPTIEKINGKNYIAFKPKLSNELKKHSEDSLKVLNEQNKYLSLKLWAKYKFENKEEYKKDDYLKYENNPNLVVKETKSIIQKLENTPGDFNFPFFSKQTPSFKEDQRRGFDQDNSFRITNHSIPLYTCAVLMRDYFDKLNQEDKTFCQEAIMKCVFYLIQNDNPHSSIEGKDLAVRAFSFLFPEKKSEIKSMLFALLIKGGNLNKHTIRVIIDMWEDNFAEAYSLFLGYLLLKQKFDTLIIEKHRIANKNFNYNYSESEVLNSFLKEHEKDIEDIMENKLTYNTISKSCNFKEFHL